MSDMTIQNAIHCMKAMICEEVCEECDYYGNTGTDHCEADAVRMAIKALEEQPERKKGKWIDTGATPFTNNEGQLVHEKMCSKCKSIAYFRSVCGIMIANNVCPNCGSDMRGEADG